LSLITLRPGRFGETEGVAVEEGNGDRAEMRRFETIRDYAQLDLGRENRKGVPEVVLAENKDPELVIEIIQVFLEKTGRALVSRIPADLVERIQAVFAAEADVRFHKASRMAVVKRRGVAVLSTGGRVGVITAGTSDVPIAEEAKIIAEEMGCEVTTVYDVGVAGLHRLFQPLHDLLERDVDVIIVAAGMDGALPSVVSGLVSVPVIGLPTSVGYGLGGHGVTAILSMLQTCSPGLTVVNINNGIGAGATAAMFANRVAAARASAAAEAGSLSK
jgi:NCAIR mutase (PurE)-related protein